MFDRRSKQTEAEEATHVGNLLSLLGGLSQRDPSPALRERLSALAHHRLKEEPEAGLLSQNGSRRPLAPLKPAFAVCLLVAIGLATVLIVRDWPRVPVPATNRAAKADLPAISSDSPSHSLPKVRPSSIGRPKIHHPRSILTPSLSTQEMTMRLPYSNSAIDSGNSATIRVSMSQSDLASLGFPVNASAQSGWIVAELTLGDDGLPRAISVPLPLEVIKEKR